MFFCFKQKAAYEMRSSDWSSDVCSSDLQRTPAWRVVQARYADVQRLPGSRIAVRGHGSETILLNVVKPFDRPLLAARVAAWSLGGIPLLRLAYLVRPEERRVGKEGVSTGRSRRSPYH